MQQHDQSAWQRSAIETFTVPMCQTCRDSILHHWSSLQVLFSIAQQSNRAAHRVVHAVMDICIHCRSLLSVEEQTNRAHGSYMQWWAFAFTVEACFQLKNRQTEPTGRTCSDGHLHSLWKLAFSWRTDKQSPRVVHAEMGICIHCGSLLSVEEQTNRAHGSYMQWWAFAFTVEACFQLKNRQTEPTGRTCSGGHLHSL